MDYKKLLFTIDGRLNRQPFWLCNLAFIVIDLILLGVSQGGGFIGSALQFAGSIVVLWASICIAGKRWHDRDKSAWWILIGLVPIIGWIWTFVEAGCLKGAPGPNRFGPNPLGE